MGLVHLVADRLNGGRLMALKQIVSGKLSNDALQSIAREFRLLTKLRHPNLVEVYDFSLHPECHLTMEHVQGVPWHLAKLEPTEQIAAAIQLLRALSYIHQRGLVHLDIKPQNVLVQRRAGGVHVKLMDFGVARDPNDLEGFGYTQGFAAPEVVSGEPFDHRADLYSLGMLLGVGAVINATTTLMVTQGTAKTEPGRTEPQSAMALSHLPEATWPIVRRLAAPEPNARYDNADVVCEAFEAVVAIPSKKRSHSGALLQTSELVSRSDALEQLRAIYKAGGALCVNGPSGTGKTRLLGELKAMGQLAGDVVVYESALRQRGLTLAIMRRTLFQLAALALVPVPELLAPLVYPGESLHADALQGTDAQMALLTAAIEFVLAVANKTRVVVIVDDFDEADATSRAFLTRLAQSGAKRLPIVIAAQDSPPGFVDLPLRPFTKTEAPALIRSLFAQEGVLSDALAISFCERAGGDASLLFELLRLSADRGMIHRSPQLGWRSDEAAMRGQPWPSTLEATSTERMTLRRRVEQDVLACAALLGGTSDPEVLSQALNLNTVHEILADLLTEGFLVVEGQRFGFVSAAAQRAALLLAETRSDAELFARNAAVALEQAAGAAEDIAHVWARSDEPLKAIPHYVRAASEALAVYDYERAESQLRAALTLQDDDALRTQLAQAALWRGDPTVAEQEALRAARSDQPHIAAKAMRLAGLAATALGRLDEAIARLSIATSGFAALNDVVLQGQALNETGLAHMYAVRFDVALERHKEALFLLEQVSGNEAKAALAQTHDNLGFAYLSLGHFRNCERHLLAALALHVSLGDAYGEAVTHNHLGNMLRQQGDYEAARTAYDRSLALCARTGNRLREAITLNNLGFMADEADDFDGAIELFGRALALVDRMHDKIRKGDNIGCIGACLLRAGQPDEAIGTLDLAVGIRRELSDFGYLVTDLSYRALAYVARGEALAARRDIDEAIKILDSGVFGTEQPQNVFLNAFHTYHSLGDDAAAQAALRRGVNMVREQMATTCDARREVLFATRVRCNRELLRIGRDRLT
jgi:tetratricopeptide (TPR) repeat protein